MTVPAITVLMPVYNGARFLREAVDSILKQTFTDFELLIVDDGSTDETPQILAECAAKDTRIRILRNERNLQIAASLNRGLREARAPLIARMDTDDIALPQRLETQAAFMKAHPEVTICGSFMAYHDAQGAWTGAVDDAAIRARMLFENPLAHPAVMYRRDGVLGAGGYDETMPPAEDYALWAKMAEDKNIRFANIPEVLLRYRTHPQRVRREYGQRRKEHIAMIHRRQLERLGFSPSSADLATHWICAGHAGLSVWEELRARRWMHIILQANKTRGQWVQAALSEEVSWRHECLRRQRGNIVKWILRPVWRLLPESARSAARRVKENIPLR